ncbi:uroporphyrinogen decarboxylase [Bogoriella caseilytica]|uniref:Uroporphyrinogen decarboxylase n=1 Tax=Bogoriella caseilytica TaxID=56055 RepID=A0A3N2BEJ3_9MICO|nr:uroporphyrinogen decarboxylase [Bogoriella caseilytica]ROR73652.1 uroporphyrinogen decarboxylase [Bogoriella caseilytica]
MTFARDLSVTSSPLLTAYSGTRPDRLPVWFMRQAGRSLPEYRELRQGTEMLESCLRPEMAAEITCQPVRRHGVDAAIFFSDIVIPLKLAGVDVEIVSGVGPVIGSPVRSAADVDRLTSLPSGEMSNITEAVQLAVSELSARPEPVPLIGFGGAPFTLAAYLVEGRPSRDHLAARAMMHADPAAWDKLLTWAADITGDFLRAQVAAGAQAVQLFDSWAGSLSVADYTERAAPYSARALAAVEGLVPRVHFGTGTSEILTVMRDAGAEVVGVDHRIGLDEATRRLGAGTVLQGNIDSALLTAPWEVLERHVKDVIARGRSAAAHVLNLGHGVPPTTDPGVLTRIVELAHSE